LAVDDDRFFREFYTDLLSREGYAVDAVADAKTCLERLDENAYDLIVLDLILEDMSGIELAAKIRERSRGLEIVMVTKVDDLASINRALELGIREYILKPINEAEFIQTVANILERQRVFLEHGRLLAESVEHVYTLSIYKRGLAILAALDIEALVELVLDGCMQECEAAGAVLWLRDETEPALFKEQLRRGLVEDGELQEFTFSEYRHHDQLISGVPFFPRTSEGADRDSIHVPLIHQKELLGLVKLRGKLDGRFRNKDLQTLRMLGEFSSIAVQNAFTVRDLKQRVSRGENFILTPERFSSMVERERTTAARYNRAFSLVELDVPEGGRDIDAFLQEQLREADAVTRLSPGVFRFFLPQTDGIGARSFGRRIISALRTKGLAHGGELLMPIHASFPADGESLAELEAGLLRRRGAYEGSLARQLKPGDFSALCQEILARQGREAGFDKNGFLDILQFLLADAESDARRKSAMFLGIGKMSPHRGWLEEKLYGLGKQGRVSLFGDTAGFRIAEAAENIVAIHVPSPPGNEQFFALYLTADSGYVALYQRDGGQPRTFHALDEYLADHLILALQEQYFLQRQL
jgi:CheY-like chemotaxis protein